MVCIRDMGRVAQVLQQRLEAERKITDVWRASLLCRQPGRAVEAGNQRQRGGRGGLRRIRCGAGKNPQQALCLCRGESSGIGARAARCLGVRHVHTCAAAVEAPAVVGAFQAAILGDAALRQRCQAMWARVQDSPPVAVLISPQSHALAHHRDGNGHPRVQRVERGKRIPVAAPVEASGGRSSRLCVQRRGACGDRGGRRQHDRRRGHGAGGRRAAGLRLGVELGIDRPCAALRRLRARRASQPGWQREHAAHRDGHERTGARYEVRPLDDTSVCLGLAQSAWDWSVRM